MRGIRVACALFVFVTATGCSVFDARCAKDVECRESLDIDVGDDTDAYAQRCSDAKESLVANARARDNPQCDEVANSQELLASCQADLSCEDLANEGGDDATCADEAARASAALINAQGECFDG